ncbi:substrate-binding domain-containing protein [Sediminispirochaeta bajacaliforniensis]|uniref:substrate-binding domain-containing protein n=1 Tax=Sediminispirochaeta bajacaliforniensis TaxID=148 RepID=UPI00037E3CA2|nr:substrate-binding domain-containing protein [Sediminispirochaeta bajacaliforniensis]
MDKNIGVFTAELNDAYQAAVWKGIVSQAQALELGLVCFLGSRVKSPIATEQCSNIAYSLADKENIDGLIIISSAISTYLDFQAVTELFRIRSDLPQVSVGLGIPGIPSIIVDGRIGMVSVIRHLVEVHARRSFALISGPSGHLEADARKKAFFDTLADYTIPFDRRLMIEGSFEQRSGSEGVRALLAEGIPFDALVCLNDKMALGALDELSHHGISVPDDVALVGFDGIEETLFCQPPLTTVRQPLFELGAAAVEEVCALIHGGKGQNRYLNSSVRIGESCGCRHSWIPDASKLDSWVKGLDDFERDTMARLRAFIFEENESGFLEFLERGMMPDTYNGEGLRRFHTLLYAIQQELLSCGESGERGSLSRRLRLISTGLGRLTELTTRILSSRRLKAMERNFLARSIGAALAEAFEMESIVKTLSKGLVSLGFSEAYLVIFLDSRDGKELSRVFPLPLAEGDDPMAKGYVFKTTSLLPDQIDFGWKRKQWVLKPLVYQHEPLGYILLPVAVDDPALYDLLSKQISSTVKGARLLEQVRSHEKSLEEEVSRRTAELTKTNECLQTEVDRRIRLEQEVIDISNNTMNRIGQDLHDDLCQHLAGISMITEVLKNSLEPGSHPYEVCTQINDLIINSVDRAKGIARGLVPVGLKENGFIAAVDTLLEALRKGNTIDMRLERSPDFFLKNDDRALQLYRIVQEALSNSIKHANCSHIMVKLHTQQKGNGRLIEIIDDGTGFSDKDEGNGMGLKIMRYRAEKAQVHLLVEKMERGTKVSCLIPQELCYEK